MSDISSTDVNDDNSLNSDHSDLGICSKMRNFYISLSPIRMITNLTMPSSDGEMSDHLNDEVFHLLEVERTDAARRVQHEGHIDLGRTFF